MSSTTQSIGFKYIKTMRLDLPLNEKVDLAAHQQKSGIKLLKPKQATKPRHPKPKSFYGGKCQHCYLTHGDYSYSVRRGGFICYSCGEVNRVSPNKD